MIRTYATDAAGFAAAAAIVEAKHVWIDGRVLRVFTGDDIPPVPPPEPRMLTEDEAVAAIKRVAPTTTDRQAREAIDAERVQAVDAEAEEVRR